MKQDILSASIFLPLPQIGEYKYHSILLFNFLIEKKPMKSKAFPTGFTYINQQQIPCKGGFTFMYVSCFSKWMKTCSYLLPAWF